MQIADNLENVLHLYPDSGDEEFIADYQPQQYGHDLDVDAGYQHQYYSNQ